VFITVSGGTSYSYYKHKVHRTKGNREMILENEKIKQALEYIKEEDPATTQDTLNMCQIPAPSYKEEKKAEYIRERFREIGLRDVRIDAVGNVLGVWPGTGEGPSVMLAAHTDTVFPEGTDLTIRKEGNRYYCPGINDDTHAVAEMITVAKAMIHADLHTKGDLIFCANVCEEGLGDLRGVKYLFGYDNKASEECPEVDAFVSIDNQYTGGVIYTATGSHRYEVTFTGRGGHSFQNFGIPNPIHAMGRAIAQIAEFQVPDEPKTTFNVGVIQGGTSVNTISGSASMLVDLRSDSEEELNRLDKEHSLHLLHLHLSDSSQESGRSLPQGRYLRRSTFLFSVLYPIFFFLSADWSSVCRMTAF
jgi:tripeptide aminopeptidase